MLKRRSDRHQKITAELKTLWADPALRLQQVSSTEMALSACLRGESVVAVDDSKSDFTADSRYSQSSYVSSFSAYSTASDSSGTSTVSILSGASVHSRSSQAFSVEGLDHSLLSRGKETGPHPKKKSQVDGGASAADESLDRKSAKKKHKSTREKRGEGRTESRDVWGLRRELNLCDDLMRLTNISDLTATVCSLREALVLLSGEDAITGPVKCQLASSLQCEMNDYIMKVGF